MSDKPSRNERIEHLILCFGANCHAQGKLLQERSGDTTYDQRQDQDYLKLTQDNTRCMKLLEEILGIELL